MQTINEYQIIAKIYESANSIVYRGRQNQGVKPVILKLLKPEATNPLEITRYKQEYQIIGQLKLKGVVQADALEKHQSILVIIIRNQVKSVLATPIINQSELINFFIYK